MLYHSVRFIGTILCCWFLLAACSAFSTAPSTSATAIPVASPTPQKTPTATPSKAISPQLVPTATRSTAAPKAYDSRILLSGGARPDDLIFDTKGNLLFSDFYNGTVSRLNADGSVTILLRNIVGPEGLVVLSNGTLIIAEQRTNRILSLAPGAATPTVLRALPGMPSMASCKDGVDGIAFDATANALIIPDSPIGAVYRLSLDGRRMTLLASGFTRPVGAAVDERGNIFVADECGGALWRIAPDKTRSRMGSFGMIDDVVLDHHGNVLVTDLQPAIHALIRVNIATSKREILYSAGLIEPQGLVIDNHDNIYFSDDYTDVIVRLSPRA